MVQADRGDREPLRVQSEPVAGSVAEGWLTESQVAVAVAAEADGNAGSDDSSGDEATHDIEAGAQSPQGNARAQAAPGSNIHKRASSEHWRDESEFRKVEMEIRTKIRNRRREVKDSGGASVKGQLATAGTGFSNDLFLSHCWRGRDTQMRKRELVAGLNDPRFQDPNDDSAGFAYWGDFLDLQQDGPVAWRKEIEDGIQTAAKVVALIDAHYLHSFNCIQELAFCFKYGKPIVPIILDQRAWEILTSVNGAEQAYSGIMCDAAGHPLSTLQDQEGQPIMEGQPLDLKWLTNLFAKLSSINFCPCREADSVNFGRDGMLEMMLKFVRKDITYLKEHNELQRRADLWMTRGGTSRSSALLSGKDINMWRVWVDNALKYEYHPPPTPLQQDYVQKSRSFKTLKKRLLFLAVSVAMAAIIGLAVWAGIAAKEALEAKAVADEQKQIAEANAILAQEQQLIAQEQQLMAEESEAAARASESKALAAETKATMMLLLQASPLATPAQARAVAEAVEIATATGAESTAQTELYKILKDLQQRRFWLMGQVSGPAEGYSLQSLAWSPNRAAPLLAGGFFTNGSVAIWADPRGSPLAYHLAPSHSSQPVSSLAWATAPADGGAQVLATGHDDGVVTLWSASGRGELSRAETFIRTPEAGQLFSRVVAWQPGAPARLAVGSMASDSVFVYSYPDLELVQELNHSARVNSLAYSSDGTGLLAIGLRTGDVAVWNLTRAQEPLESVPDFVLTNMTSTAFTLAWSGDLLAVGSHDPQAAGNFITVWTLTRATDIGGEPSVVASIECAAMVNSLAWSAEEVPMLGAALDDGSLYTWTASTVLAGGATATSEFAVGTKAASLTSVAFSPQGVMASAPYGAGLSDADQGALALSLWRLEPIVSPISQTQSVDQAGSVLVYPDFSEARLSWGAGGTSTKVVADVNGSLLDFSGWGTAISVFDSAGPSKMSTVASWTVPGFANSLALGGGADGALLALGATDSENGTITLFDIHNITSTGAPVVLDVLVDPGSGSITAMAWSRAEGVAFLASGSTSGTVRVWQQGMPGPLLATHSAAYPGATEETPFAVTSVAWSRDGRLASGAKDGSAKVYLAPLAPGSDVISLQPGGPLPAFNLPTPVNAVAWSESGQLAIGTGTVSSGTVQLWSSVSGNQTATVFDLSTAVRALAWAADGRLLQGLGDGSVRISVVDDPTSPVWVINQDASATGAVPAASSAGFSEDGKDIAVVFSNGDVNVVAASFDTYATAVESLTVGELSADDLQLLGMPFVGPTLGIRLDR